MQPPYPRRMTPEPTEIRSESAGGPLAALRIRCTATKKVLALRPLDSREPAPYLLHPDARKWRNWQTRWIQVPVPARVWGFNSPLSHQLLRSLGSIRPLPVATRMRPERQPRDVGDHLLRGLRAGVRVAVRSRDLFVSGHESDARKVLRTPE